MELVNAIDESMLSPFFGSNSRALQSPSLCSNKSTSISLSSTPAGFSSSTADAPLATALTATTSIDLLDNVKADGSVDLSGMHLGALIDAGAKQRKSRPAEEGEHLSILQLNVAQNSLRSLDCANLPLQQCIEIDASHNELSQMRCLSPLANHLVHLHLSDNRISSLGSLNNFCCLQTLDLSHNRIEHFPVLDKLAQLRHLNLASNHIKSIPNLFRLISLVELDLHGNAIRSLDSVRNFLPKNSLRLLDIGGNLLSDICEFHHFNNCGLPLEALIVVGNPCTKVNNIDQRTFSYRSFIFSCVLGDLKLLDGYLLSEKEQLIGEKLHTDSQSRSFRPGTGAHADLCAYLEQHCPSEHGEMSLMEDKKLSMVLQKRREYNRSQSSTIITARIGENGVKMDERKADNEGMKRKTPEQRQQKVANGNRNGAKTTTTTTNNGRTQTKKTTAFNGKKDGGTKMREKAEEQRQTPIVRMSKSVTQLIRKTTTPSEEDGKTAAKERSHSAMDGSDTNRTVSTLVQNEPVSPARTVILLNSSLVDTVQLEFCENESNVQQRQYHVYRQQQSVLLPIPFPPSPPSASTDVLPVFPAPSTSQFLPQSTTSITSPVTSRIPINVASSLNAHSLRHRKYNTLQKVGHAATTTLQQKKSLRPMPSSSLSFASVHRQKFAYNNERKMGAIRWNSTTAEEQQKEESTCSSKGSKKKGRFSSLARKFNIRRKSSTGPLQSKRFSPKSVPQQTPHTLKSKVEELTKQNNLLTRINGEHVMTFQELAAKINQLEKEMSVRHAQDQQLRSLLIPTPSNLICKRQENSEKGNDVVEIVWENVIPLMSAVDSYELFLNGQKVDPAEPIKAKTRRLRITDLNPAEEIKVAIRAVSSTMDGIRSATSEINVAKRCTDEEGKENSASSAVGRPFQIN